MRDPGFAREAVASLPATLFDDGERRELFTMISESVSARRSVDPLLMAWAADQRTSPGPDGERAGWLTPDYVRGVAALPPSPGKPSWLAQMLLNDGTSAPEPDQTTDQKAESAPLPEPDSAPQPDSAEPTSASKPTVAPAPKTNPAPAGLAPAPELMEMPPQGPEPGGVTPQM